MKPFALEPQMLTLAGAFYPTGYLFLMFPSADDAQQVEHAMRMRDYETGETMLLEPAEVLHDVVHPASPAAQTYAELAQEGHCALMIHAPSDEESERVMEIVRAVPHSVAKKYSTLAVEDLD